jgi:hypothetical protein
MIIQTGQSTIFIRKPAYERSGIARAELDSRFNLTDAEFRVEGQLVILGPLPVDEMAGEMVEYLETSGLVYFEDFFELSGNWPDWLNVSVT